MCVAGGRGGGRRRWRAGMRARWDWRAAVRGAVGGAGGQACAAAGRQTEGGRLAGDIYLGLPRR